MAQAAVRLSERTPIDASETAILDRAHLSRMTFGDRGLEREVLQLFDRQAELLMQRIHASAPAAIVTLAHTLKGSAVGIGASRVARAAANTELAAGGMPADLGAEIDQLARAVAEARTHISALLSAQ